MFGTTNSPRFSYEHAAATQAETDPERNGLERTATSEVSSDQNKASHC